MADPTISVIIPCADAGHYLPAAVASVRQQTHQVDEIIIVHPVDDLATPAVVEHLGCDMSPRLRIASVPERRPAAARNVGLLAATGDIIGFLDADDAWAENKIALQLARLSAAPEIEAVGGLTQLCHDINPETLSPIEVQGDAVCAPSLGALLCQRAVFDKIGIFDGDLIYCEDLEFYMRMRDMDVPFVTLAEPVQYYRQHQASLMHANTPRKQSDFRLAVLKSIRRRRGLGLAPASALVLSDSIERA